MANIKDLKVRINSTKSTLKITSAMKLVSAAKLSKAQHRIQGFKPYSSELDATIRVASALVDNYSHSYLTEQSSKKVGILIVSSEKGLCGSYNSSVYKKVKAFAAANPDYEIEYYFIGRKVKELLARDGVTPTHVYEYEGSEPTFADASKIAAELSAKFKSSEISKLFVAYNSFVSAIEFTSEVKQALPMTISEEEKQKLVKEFPVDFKYEPSPEEILDSLIPEVFITTIYQSLLDAVAAEHATRMTAMDNATTNSKDMIRNLTLKANKLRQAAITTELTEIVSGAESLNG